MWKDNITYVRGNFPDCYEGIRETDYIVENLDKEIDIFKRVIVDITNDVIVDLATINGIERYEKIWGIIPLVTDSLEARRRKILAKFRDKPPINEQAVIAISETYLGVEVVIRHYDDRKYYFEVRYRHGQTLIDAKNLLLRLRDIVPANMAFNVVYDFVTWGELVPYTWGQVAQKTWKQIQLGGV